MRPIARTWGKVTCASDFAVACCNTGQVFKMQSSMTPMTPYTKARS